MAMSQSAFSRLSVNGTRLCFVRIKDMTKHSLVDGAVESICGSLYLNKDRVDLGIVMPKLQILMQPSPEEWEVLLPWMGFVGSGGTYTLDDDITNMPHPLILDRVGSIDDLGNAYVDKWIMRGSKGTHPVSLELQVACDAAPDIGNGVFSASLPSPMTAPYAFHRGALTLESSAREFDSFMVVGDNHLAIQHNNSNVPTAFQYGMRTFHLGVSIPYVSGNTAVLTNPIASAAGAAGSLTYTRGGQSMAISFTNLKSEPTPPDIPGKSEDPLQSEIRLKMFYQSYMNTSVPTKPITITTDATA